MRRACAATGLGRGLQRLGALSSAWLACLGSRLGPGKGWGAVEGRPALQAWTQGSRHVAPCLAQGGSPCPLGGGALAPDTNPCRVHWAADWRVAGMSYLKYSNLCAEMVRAALKEPAKAKVKPREVIYFRSALWKNGQPEKQGAEGRGYVGGGAGAGAGGGAV